MSHELICVDSKSCSAIRCLRERNHFETLPKLQQDIEDKQREAVAGSQKTFADLREVRDLLTDKLDLTSTRLTEVPSLDLDCHFVSNLTHLFVPVFTWLVLWINHGSAKAENQLDRMHDSVLPLISELQLHLSQLEAEARSFVQRRA